MLFSLLLKNEKVEIKSEDIQDLIKLGMTTVVDQDQLLKFKHRDFINRQHWSKWEKLVVDLTDLELISVFKVVIKLERELKWIGGSVAGAIWIYKIISQKRLDDNYSLADFGLKNSVNPYVPFGSYYNGERNIQGYFLHQKERARSKATRLEEDKAFRQRAQNRRKRRSAAIAELRKLSYEERGSIRAKNLEENRSGTIQQRLEIMAADEKYPPEYYPPEWIHLSRNQIQELPFDLVKKLYDKLSSKTKGEWRRFSQKLQNIEEVKLREKLTK